MKTSLALKKDQEVVSIGSNKKTHGLYKSENIKKRKINNAINCYSLKVGETGTLDGVGVGGGGEVWDGGAVSSIGSRQGAGVEKILTRMGAQSATATLGGKPVPGDSTK